MFGHAKFARDCSYVHTLARGFFPAVLISLAMGLAACGGGDSGLGANPAGTPFTIGGKIQKGPFLIGSSVTIQELGDDLEPTGASFNTTTDNDLGHFNTTVEIASSFAEVITDGFFYDEVSDNFAASQITLRTVSAFTEGQAVNINLLTQLARERIKFLVLTGSTFADALAQAQGEILSAFNVQVAGIADFDTLDIAGTGTGNAALLAISAVLMQTAITRAGAGSIVAELSNLLATIGSDIEQDGTLDSQPILDDIRQAGIDVDLAAVRANLERRYFDLGETVTAAPFEDFVDADGDGILPVDDDNLPEPFPLGPAVIDASAGTVYLSDLVIVSGILGVASVTLTNGILVENGIELDPDGTGTTETSVVNGDTLQVMLTSSSNFVATVTATLTIGLTSEVFSVTTHVSPWTSKTPMPTARAASVSSVVGGKIFVIGGAAPGSLDIVEEYDPATDTWTNCSPDPNCTVMPTARSSATGSEVGGIIYVIGGSSGSRQDVEAYDTGLNSWSAKAPMPAGRAKATSSVVGGKIYVIGGNNFGFQSDVEEYDPVTDTWTDCDTDSNLATNNCAPMPTARDDLTSSVVNGKIYAIGGIDTSFTAVTTVEEYDPASNTWTNCGTSAPGNGCAPTPTVAVGTSHVVGGKIYVFSSNTTQVYDPATNTWTNCGGTCFPMPTARGNFTSSVVGGKIFVIGGAAGGNKDTVEEYDPAGDF